MNPCMHTLTQCLRNVLLSPSGMVHIVYAGAMFRESGSWILSDGTFSATNMVALVEREWGEKQCSLTDSMIAAGGSGSSSPELVCNGHSSIVEHLAAHDVVVRMHIGGGGEQPLGDWAFLTSLFANHRIDLAHVGQQMSTSLTSLLLEQAQKKNSKSIRVQAGSSVLERRHLFHFDLNSGGRMNNSVVDNASSNSTITMLVDYLQERLQQHYAKQRALDLAAVFSQHDGHQVPFIVDQQLVQQQPQRSATPVADDSDDATPEVVGHVRLDQPTLYIFPAGQGDATMLALDGGFAMLIDGGFLPAKHSFWNFVRHLEKLDSIVVSERGEVGLIIH